MKKHVLAKCEMNVDGGAVSILFEGSKRILRPLEDTLGHLAKPGTFGVFHSVFWSEKVAMTLETSESAGVVSEAVQGLFDDGYELDRDGPTRFFSF
jgi:hypothetical protein